MAVSSSSRADSFLPTTSSQRNQGHVRIGDDTGLLRKAQYSTFVLARQTPEWHSLDEKCRSNRAAIEGYIGGRSRAQRSRIGAVIHECKIGQIGSFGGCAQNRTRFDPNPYWIATQSARGLIKIQPGFARDPYWIAIKSSKDFCEVAGRCDPDGQSDRKLVLRLARDLGY